MKIRFTQFLFVALCFLAGSTASIGQTSLDPELNAKVKAALKENGQTIQFMENKGQISNPNVLYYFDSKQGAVYVEKNKLVIVNNYFKSEDHKFLPEETELIQTGKHTFTIHFNGSNPNPQVILGEQFRTKYNYFAGQDSTKWVRGARAAKELTLSDLYKGIDLRLYSTSDGTLEFDWIVKPFADLEQIHLEFTGQDSLNILKDGSLSIGLRESKLNLHIPESYQVTEKGKSLIKLNFKQDGKHISFQPSTPINPSYPLIIDPTLIWGTLMDGNFTSGSPFDEYLYAIELDTITGILYCGGATNRNLPTTSAPYDADGYLNTITGLTGGSNVDYRAAVLYRISSTGLDLVDLTLFGPATIATGQHVRIHALSVTPNRVFVGGNCDVAIPLAGASFDATRNNTDGWVAQFSKDLGTLYYSTYLGGTGNETDGVISLKALSDETFIYAMTAAADLLHAGPTYFGAAAYDTTFNGGSDMYIGKFAGATVNKLTWGTYIGGAQNETINDIAIAPDGRVAFAGW